ncbi:MAG: 2-succinyl-5-enolpyruvyl-6-hydroxy-3-cyclohexene-1-carboxylic-acid synthase [Chlorobi bacterium]|nr:2-succinyl-5-enolpyruvyl-6-hydroxy-3-cyclohexene-1-carboxylic-acid synthase [Chlorobiota bacterium]
MTSDKKNISLLADIFVKHGLTNIIISPGSRNAPIIISFANNPKINTFTIVDERSAAFFALGMALQTGKTTAIACTSGSAALNYASAISEAYYQKIPLLILTADRPQHLIDVGDGQTIRQNEVFKNYVKKSCSLPLEINSEAEKNKCEQLINEAINTCISPRPGPVHINIPFNEPLYNTEEENFAGKAETLIFKNTLPDENVQQIVTEANRCKKLMILVGQAKPDKELNETINNISKHENIVVLSETTSNIYGENIIDTIDNVVSTLDEEDLKSFKPDILISIKGQVVSKMIKKFFRNNKPSKHYHISPSGEKMDTFFCLTDAIGANETEFIKSLSEKSTPVESDFSSLWKQRKNNVDLSRDEYLNKLGYSDFKVFESIINRLPEKTSLHLGNSTPVRYSQLFGSKKGVVYNSNRGVSGIDGQVSTAAGYSFYSDKLNVLISGDLGFFYDSNSLMNNYLKPTLKIIVINNSGGGIFRFIPGPDTTPNMEESFVAKHNWKAEYICKAFDIGYLKATNQNEVEQALDEFFIVKSKTQVLEIFTPSDKSALILREYFKVISKNI